MFGDDCAYRHDQPSEEDEPRDLPEELLLFILSLLPYKSLNNSALVSSKWHRVATDPSLWQDKIISITDSTFHLLGQVLSMPRLARVNYLDLRLDYIMPVAKDMLAIQESQLEMLEMDWSDFSLVEPTVLANTMLNVRQSDVIHFDANALLSLLADSVNSKLEQLHLNQTDLAEVEVEVFTRAVTKLTTLQMTDLRQEKSHLSALFLVLAEQKTPLRRLMLAGSPLRELEISEEVLAQSLNKLEVAEVEGMNRSQAKAFFHQNPGTKSNLLHLELNQCDFSLVSQTQFAARLNRLQKLDLQFCEEITLGQMKALLSSKTSNLTHLVLSNSIDLSDIEPKLLADKVAKLSRVEMNDVNNLSSMQVEEIFKLLDNEKKEALPLATLGLAGIDLSSVPIDRLARVVNSLERANLCRTNITCCQLKRLLLGPEALATRLKVLNLKGSPIISQTYHWSDLAEIAQRIPLFAYRNDQCGHTLQRAARKDFANNDLHDFLSSH